MPPNISATPSTNEIRLHLHCAALLLGGTALFSKLIPYGATDIIAYRALICGLVLLAIAKATNQRIIPRSQFDFALMVVCSALFTIHWTAYFHAMQVSTVAIGIVSMFSFPVITVLLESFIKGTQLRYFDVLMGMLVLFGVYLMVPTFSLEDNITQGVLFGVLSGFAVALRNVCVGKWLTNYSAFTIMSYHSLISAAILLPIALVSVSDIDAPNWLLLILLATIFTAIPHTQKTFGLRYEAAKTVSIIVSLQVVYATVFAYFLLSESVSINTLIGGGLILSAALIESIGVGKQSKS